MNNRDNIVEDKLKNTQEQIPDSLRPENIEQKLAGMSMDEKYKRSQSQDIVDSIAPAPVKKRNVVVPIVIAASVLLLGGLVTYPFVMRQLEKNRVQISDETVEDDEEFEHSGDSYELAYDNYKRYKKQQKEVAMIDYDTVDYAVEEAAEDTEASLNTTGATYAKREDSEVSVDFTDTNVRTEGVGEADVVKTDGKYIYRYDGTTEHLFFYSVDDGEIEKEGSVNVLDDDYSFSEMYIYGDKLVLMGVNYDGYSYYSYYNTDCRTYIGIYDISDKGEPKLEKEFTQSGYYNSSRMVDGVLYTFSTKRFDLEKLKKKKYDTYIPDIDGDLIEPEDVYVYNDVYEVSYTVISSVDVEKEKIIDKKAIMSGGSTLYVSADNIYFANHRYDWTGFAYQNESSLIKISYDDGDLKYESTGTFPGYLLNDYCIDEYDGYVRLVTTYTNSDYMNANGLYILDENLEKVSVIKNLAEGETIKSARFMGETGYFVTFRNTDPLFAVDLSDPENPKLTDYLKIPGFSEYLHPYADGKMLGIGYDADEETGWVTSIKFTMFDTSDPYNIKEENTKVYKDIQQAAVLSDRNALMFNSNDGTFGFGVYVDPDYYSWMDDDDLIEEEEYDEDIDEASPEDATAEDATEVDPVEDLKLGYYYMVFDYDDEDGFENLLSHRFNDFATYASLNNSRGIVIGDYIYVVSDDDGLTSYDTKNYDKVDECN